jgi:transcription elongation factor GreA
MMYDELTAVDIKKMQEEIDYRVNVLRPQMLEDVKTARAFGDLSENFEYKAAKQVKNRNDSRIRYLERMIKTAKVISAESRSGEVGLFDTVEIYFEEDDETQTIRLVTTLRQDALQGLISPVSPLGKALMGRKAGDRVRVEVNSDYSYHVVIRTIEKGADDESLPISTY